MTPIEQAALVSLTEFRGDELARSIDAAADDLLRNGPVLPAELRKMLIDIEAEWAAAPDVSTTQAPQT